MLLGEFRDLFEILFVCLLFFSLFKGVFTCHGTYVDIGIREDIVDVVVVVVVAARVVIVEYEVVLVVVVGANEVTDVYVFERVLIGDRVDIVEDVVVGLNR